MMFVLYFYTIYDENTGKHTMDTFLILTNSDYLTKHITLELFPFQLLKGAYSYYLLLVYLPE